MISKIIKQIGRIRIILILPLITINVMAQTKYKTVKEAKGLQVGDNVENFSAIDVNKEIFILSEALKKGPVVIIFYRGQWCPVCNRHLSDLQDSIQIIYDKGATVVAISPEKPEYSFQTSEKTNATFSLLYDEGYKISDVFDVTFRPSSITRTMYNTIGANLKNAHSDDSQRLPIPATFIINKKGKIIWRQFDPNYKHRSSVKEIIEALK